MSFTSVRVVGTILEGRLAIVVFGGNAARDGIITVLDQTSRVTSGIGVHLMATGTAVGSRSASFTAHWLFAILLGLLLLVKASDSGGTQASGQDRKGLSNATVRTRTLTLAGL
jgi:hypothetical protein